MQRTVTLNAASAGMTRLRDKGGASPQSLYELTNCYISASRAPTQRPGVRLKADMAALYPSSVGLTKGLVAYRSQLYTFSASQISSSAPYNIVRLIHPTPGFSGSISEIHYAKPFMGLLYVVAQFSDNGIYHYWLQNPEVWQTLDHYSINDLIQPTTANGYYYKATMLNPPNAWQPNTLYSTLDTVQPTEANGFAYVAAQLYPTSPTSSTDTEPVWPTVALQVVIESTAGGTSTQPAPPEAPAATPPGRGDGGRYSNPGGSGNATRGFLPLPRTP